MHSKRVPQALQVANLSDTERLNFLQEFCRSGSFLASFFCSVKRMKMNEKVKIKKHYPSYKDANKNKKKEKITGLTKRKIGYFYPRKRNNIM